MLKVENSVQLLLLCTSSNVKVNFDFLAWDNATLKTFEIYSENIVITCTWHYLIPCNHPTNFSFYIQWRMDLKGWSKIF